MTGSEAKMRAMGVLVLAAVLLTVLPAAAEPAAASLFKMKAGACQFRLVDASGVKPVVGSTLSLAGVADGKVAAQAVSDKQGTCALDIAAGRYVLSVEKTELAILEAVEDSPLKDCRIVVPAAALQVGGQDAPPPPSLNMTPFIIGGGVFLVGGVTAAIIVNNNDEDGGGTTPTPTPTPAPTPRPTEEDDGGPVSP